MYGSAKVMLLRLLHCHYCASYTLIASSANDAMMLLLYLLCVCCCRC